MSGRAGFGHLSADDARVAVWLGLAVVVLISLLVPALQGRGQAGYLALMWMWSVLAALACVAAVRARQMTGSIERRFWTYSAVALMFVAASEAYEAGFATFVSTAGPQSPSVANLFDVLAAATFAALIVSLTRFRHASWAARARYWLDLLALVLVSVAVLQALVVAPWFASYAQTNAYLSTGYAMYPVIGALLMWGTLRMVVGMRMTRWEPWERLLVGSVGCFAAGLVLQPAWYLDVTHRLLGGWVAALTELALLCGVYLAGAAAVYRHMYRDTAWRLRPLALLEPSYGWVSSVVMPSIEVLAIPVFGLFALTLPDMGGRDLRLGLVFTLAGILAVRTALTLADNGALRSTAVSDPLTGLFNHRHFHDRLRLEIEAAARYGEKLALIMIDLDDFSRANSVGGHAAGDETLVGVSRAIERAVRVPDVVCRIGGDEIAVILPETDAASALAVASRALDEIRSIPAPSGQRMTASAGVAAYPELASDGAELVKRTDGALYWAKFHGKDRVVLYDPEVVITLDVEERMKSLRMQADLAAVRALAAAVDARDESPEHPHSRNVATSCTMVGRSLGFDERHLLLLEFAALLHDVGKIGVPDAVIRKNAPLTRDERLRVQAHAVLGEQILASTPLKEILPWVRHHHERWDGTGYPDGLRGTAIPLEARIIAVCSAFDAMTSGRPHRSAVSRAAALQEIDLCLGTRFDPDIGELFIRLMGKGQAA